MDHKGCSAFQTGNNRNVSVKAESLVAVKRKFAETEDSENSSCKRTDIEVTADNTGFVTASNKKVTVSEEALAAARRKFQEDPPSTVHSGSATAPISKIRQVPLVDAANKLSDLCEQSVGSIRSPLSPSPRNLCSKPRGFISPMTSNINRLQLNSPVTPSPLTNSPMNYTAGRSKPKSYFQTPFRTKILKADNSSDMPSPTNKPESKASTSWSDEEERSDANDRNILCTPNPSTIRVTVPSKTNEKTVNIADLHHHLRKHVDIFAVVSTFEQFIPVKTCDIMKACFELSDTSGSVFCDFFIRNPPKVIEIGTVILIRQAFVKENLGKPRLLVNCKSTVCFHVCSQEAEVLRVGFKRFAKAPSSSQSQVTTRNAHCGLDYGELKVIGKLDGCDRALVKGYIYEVNCDNNIAYLGCSKCKVKLGNQNERCVRCDSTESRYYYVVQITIFDFSGSVKATVFDPVATKLIGEDADESAKLLKYHPDKLRKKLSQLEFSPPLIFKIVRKNDKWLVEDFMAVNLSSFSKFLNETVISKKLVP